MEKQDIINLFLKKRLQLDSGSLEFFQTNPKEIDDFLGKLKQAEMPPTITPEFIQKTLHHQKTEIELIKKPVIKKGRVSSQDYVQYLLDRFDKISSILGKKLGILNLVSIGKIGQKTRRFSLIGMVMDKDESNMSVTIEDTTGSATLFFDEKEVENYRQIVLDEVVGLVCEQSDRLKAKNVVWPDIPLKKDIVKSDEDIFCLFVSDFHLDDSKFKEDSYKKFLSWIENSNLEKFYVFVLGDISNSKKELTEFFKTVPENCYKIFLKGEIDSDTEAADLSLRNPSLIKIKGVNILLSHGNFMARYVGICGKTPEGVMLNLLKKRHINPTLDFSLGGYEEDPFLIDIVPDIFAAGHFHSPSLTNYKGTTIITTGSFVSDPGFWLTNLKTRETIRIDFA